MIIYNCLLCSRSCQSMGRPGAPAYCALHAWKEEEAKQEGRKRISILSDKERQEEGEVAYEMIVQLEEEKRLFEENGFTNLVSIVEMMLKRKRAYLSAFD